MTPPSPAAATTTAAEKTDDDAFDDLLGDILGSDLDDDLDYSSDDPLEGDVDLNKVDEGTLDQAKKNMNVDFIKNRVRPGDEGYEFDKQVDFGVVDDGDGSGGDWDESSEEDDDE